MAAFLRLMAVWVKAIGIDRLNDRYVLGGHSLGSAIALSWALAHPAQCAALLLVGTGPRLHVNAALLDLLQSDFAAATARIAALSYGPSVEATQRERQLRHLRAVDAAVLHRAFVACNGFDVSAHLADVAAPTLILAGANDRMTPPALAQELHAGIPGSTLRILPDTGHMIPIERPQATTAAIAAFLA
jgi:pimeloyl-ACP methyl ester carboxylesterase